MTDPSDSPRSEFTARSTFTLFGASLALFCTIGFQNAFGVFQGFYAESLLRHRSQFDIAWIGSLLSFMLFSFAVPAGILVDRFGPQPPLLFGAIATVFSLFMTSLCKQYYQFLLAQGIALGISNSFLMTPAMATVSRVFDKQRGTATGIMIAGSSFGGIIWPIMLDQLLNERGVSFGWSFRAVAFVALPLCVVMVLSIRLPPKKNNPTPPPPEAEEGSISEEPKGKPKTDISIVKNRTFLLLCGGLCLATFGLFSPMFYISTYATANGLSTSLSFYLVSILNGASFVGRVSTGILADRYGNYNLCFMTMVMSGVIAMCWTKATGTVGIIFFTLAYGYTSGAMFSLQMPCASQLATPETRGTAVGLLMVAPAIPGLVGTPISGQLIPYGYLALSMYAGSFLLVGSVFILLARLRQNTKLFAKV